jgi:cysteinyl-tRNA synthetase
MKLYNTLSRKKEDFKPLKDKKVGLYTCGPTVYLFAHIGNLRTYIFEDILKRVLEYNGYEVKHLMNITDVGHLTETDSGEDKVEARAKKERKTAWEIAEFYTEAFKKDITRLNIKHPTLWAKATDHIKEQIELIETLEKKEYTYRTEDGIYFDTSKLKDYGKLAGTKERKLKAGSRVKMIEGKKNPTDFALWKFTPQGVKRQMEWDSPWGKGFPGWHTECVAMAAKHLGVPFDIHCGGIDHIPIHHTNEIAQSEAAFNENLAAFWLHGEFLNLKEERMGKSEGNLILIEGLEEKGFNPLAFRYLVLASHYRQGLNFTWQGLKHAQSALDNLYGKIKEMEQENSSISSESKKYKEQFLSFVNDDLNTPKALALVWGLIKDRNLSSKEKYSLLMDFDKVLGLGLDKIKKDSIPEEIQSLADERERYRKEKQWQKADEIRKEIEKKGYSVEDTKERAKIRKI